MFTLIPQFLLRIHSFFFRIHSFRLLRIQSFYSGDSYHVTWFSNMADEEHTNWWGVRVIAIKFVTLIIGIDVYVAFFM